MRWYERVLEIYLKFGWRRFDKIILEKSKKCEDYFFIQIGANDGVNLDPIRKYVLKYNWSGILVEPTKYIFDQLKENYNKQRNLVFENVAIAELNGYKDFYRIKEHDDPRSFAWYKQLGTFNPDVIKEFRKSIPDFDNLIVTERVKCITFRDLVEKHNVKKLDFLLIDTEGYDFEIIKLIDFAKIKPEIILYEHIHFTKAQKEECDRLLKELGYSFKKAFMDTFAYLP